MIGNRVQDVLRNLDMNQAELARTLGISRSAVGHWLQGNVKSIRSVHLFRLAEMGGVAPKWLALGEGPKRVTTDQSHGEVLDDMYYYYVTKEEHELIQAFRRMTQENKVALLTQTEFLLARSQQPNVTPIKVNQR